MKRNLLSLLFAVMVLVTACTPAERVVENPIVGAINTSTTEIAKVHLTDTATVLHVDAFFRPKNWIVISAESYLLADGKKYPIKGSDGIELNTKFWMPDSGEASFKLIFEPLPKETKAFDFIESDCDDCFKVYDIDLTGKTGYPTYPEALPEALRTSPKDGSIPAPILKNGTTKVNLHLLGFKAGMGKEIRFYFNQLFQNQKEYTFAMDENSGTSTLSFDQHGVGTGIFVFGNRSIANVTLAPGEEVDIYIDLQEAARRSKLSNYKQKDELNRTLLYMNGSYADFNRLTNVPTRTEGGIYLEPYSGEFADYNMTAEAYLKHAESKYLAILDTIRQQQGMPQMKKESLERSLQQNLIVVLTDPSFFMEHNYRATHNQWDRKTKLDYTPPTFDNTRFDLLKKYVNVNDPLLLMGDNGGRHLMEVIRTQLPIELFTNDKEGLLFDMKQISDLPYKAESASLTEEDKRLLGSLKNPFYAEMCEAIQAGALKELDAVKDMQGALETPKVSNEKLFDAIIAKHKGKVIFVDFWNTWCGPCRSSIKATEPLKEAELKSDNLVWIYIANETSPLVTYKTSIPAIKGEHYRVNPTQWAYLCDKFKVDGIPSYVIVSKDGTYGLRNDLRDHELMKKTLLEMIK